MSLEKEIRDHYNKTDNVEGDSTISNDIMEHIFNGINESLILTDVALNIKKVNQATSDILHYKEEELIGLHLFAILKENSLLFASLFLEELINLHKTLKYREVIFKAKNGENIPVVLSASVIRDCRYSKYYTDCPKYIKNQQSCKSCAAVKLIFVSNDMRSINTFTEHEKGKLTSILRDMIDGVIVINRNGVIDMVNPSGVKLLKLLTICKQGDLLVHLGDYKLKEPMELILNNKKEYISHEISVRNDSEQKTISMILAPIKDKAHITGVVIVLRDVTKEYNLQKQLLHTEKLSTIGEMVSGIAHEINNPLAGIMGLTQLLQIQPELPDAVRKNIDKIFSYTDRAKRIIQNLLTFARAHKPAKIRVNINQLLEQTIEMHEYNMKTNDIEIVKDMDLSLPDIVADMYQLQQVFFNIINNAYQSLVEYSGNRMFVVNTRKDGNKLVISFQNTGLGISKDIIKKIFNPFFTTKEIGKGTGMGLSISYGIIKEHGGDIYVTSRLGKDVTFFVELPITDIDSDNEVEIGSDDDAGPQIQDMNILIVDDEVPVAESISTLLRMDGHTCDIATEVDVAIKKLSRNDYNLIISDIRMPNLDGKEFYMYLKLHKPNLVHRFITITGDVMNPKTKQFVEENDILCVAKPFTHDELKKVISEANDNLG